MRSTLLLACSLLGCAEANSGPTVVVVPYESDGRVAHWTDEQVEFVMKGAEAWTELGFLYVNRGVDDYPYEQDMERCPRDWAQRYMTECAIPVGVTHEAFLIERYGAVGLASRADWTITIDARFEQNDLRGIAAHEFGHILLNTPRHLDAGQRGIMDPYMNGYLRPTGDDYRLACETTGICEGD